MDRKMSDEIKALLTKVIKDKISRYSPETEHKPFFEAIFTEKQIKTAALIQSFYTSFGMSFYEQLAVKIARAAGFEAENQYKLKGKIDGRTEALIGQIHTQLKRGRESDWEHEVTQVRQSIRPGPAAEDDPDRVVDVRIKKPTGEEYLIDITTVKPNKKEFDALKKKLLRWVGLRLSQDKNAMVVAAVAIPYNPYEPKPYARWTKGKMYTDKDFLVGRDFWNLMAGKEIYDGLLSVAREVGKEMKPLIDKLTD